MPRSAGSSIMDPFLRIESANDQTKGNRMFQIKKNVLKLVSGGTEWWVMGGRARHNSTLSFILILITLNSPLALILTLVCARTLTRNSTSTLRALRP